MWDDLLDSFVTVSRLAVVADATGGATRPTSSVIASNVLSNIQSANGYEQDVWLRRNIVADNVLYSTFDFDVEITATDGGPNGIRLGDVVTTTENISYSVAGFNKDQNFNITDQPLYEIILLRVVS